MIALDTNVLIRFFMQDDLAQLTRVRAVMSKLSSSDPAWIGLAVVQELVWVATKIYKANRTDICRLIDRLLSMTEIVVEQADVIRRAAHLYRETNVEFSDCLISASARAAGCTQTLTFDLRAAKSAGMTLIP